MLLYAPSDPQAGWTIAELSSQVPHHRPVWFRYALRDFHGNREQLEQALIEQLETAQAEYDLKIALLLVGLGREEGVALVREALASQDPQRTLYAIREMAALLSNKVDVGPIALSAIQVAKAARPWLESPLGETGWTVVEFALDHAFEETLNLTRSLLQDPRPGLRSRIACAFLGQGRDDGAIETMLPIIFEAPITEPKDLEVWAFRARQFADSLETYRISTGHESIAPRLIVILRKSLSLPDAAHRLRASDWFVRILRTTYEADAQSCQDLLAEVMSSSSAPSLTRACAALLGVSRRTIAMTDAIPALSELIRDESVREQVRVTEAVAWTRQLRNDSDARDPLIRALSDALYRPSFAANLADPIADLAEGEGKDEATRALHQALERTEDPYARSALASALSKLGDLSEETLAALPPWQATHKRWEISGVTPDHIAERLLWCGAINESAAEAVARVRSTAADSILLNLLEGRIIIASIRDSDSELDPKQLALVLTEALSPPIEIPQPSEEPGYQVDPRPIVDSINSALQSEGRTERVFCLPGPEGADDYALFVLADGSRFPVVASELALPLVS